MARFGGKLSLSGALNRHIPLVPVGSGTETKSASQTKSEREIKSLKEENSKLRKELADIRSLYHQLMKENSHEKFEERRVNLLKSQIMQLERQILVMTEALSSRSGTLLEVENALTWLADRCRSYITKDVKGPDVDMARSELILMVETIESARIKLYKNIDNNTTEHMARPLVYMNEFLHPSKQEEITLLDSASGKLEFLNLKHVAKLESKLSVLYRELMRLHQCISEDSVNANGSLLSCSHVIHASRDRLDTQVLKATALLRECSADLLDLSLLYPSAPWPPLRKCGLREITVDVVVRSMRGPPRSKSGDVHRVVEALVKAYNYKIYMLNNELRGLREEVRHYQSVYHLQIKYIEALFNAVRQGYTNFEESSNEVIVVPLKAIMETYVELNATATEEALKCFLTKFKDHAPQLQDAIESLSTQGKDKDGTHVLSQYGEDFFQSLDDLIFECQRKRDKAAKEKSEIREEQDRLEQELDDLLKRQEEKYQEFASSENVIMSSKDDVTSPPHSMTSESGVNKEPDLLEKGIQFEKEPKEQKKTKKSRTTEVDSNLTSRLSSLPLSEKEFSVERDKDLHGKKHDETTSEDINTKKPPSSSKQLKPVKKKLNYVPNTFVPNRTLTLRRSGSLTKLNEMSSAKEQRESMADESCDRAKSGTEGSKGKGGHNERGASKDGGLKQRPQSGDRNSRPQSKHR